MNRKRKRLICAVLFCATVFMLSACSPKKKADAKVMLQDAVKAANMRTAEYTYNSIIKVEDKYHVLYKGTVTAGIDMEKVQVASDGNVLRVLLPDVEIQEIRVDPELEFLFIKNKYETETIIAEAVALCKEDLTKQASENEKLLEVARTSAKIAVTSLTKPFERYLKPGESIVIEFSANEEGGK